MSGNSYRIPRKDRVSIDLDNFNQFNMLKVYFNAKRISRVVLVFETEHGYHIQIGLMSRNPETNIHVRNMLGDCESRMDLDNRRFNVGENDLIETLFGRVKKDYWQYEKLVNPLSEPFWEVRR